MTHDPLCLCEQCVAHDALCPWSGSLSEPDDCRLPQGWRVCDLIARVREDERGKVYGWPEYQSQRDRDVRAAAIRDAVAAVEALGDGKTVPPNDGYAEAVAAITALGGER